MHPQLVRRRASGLCGHSAAMLLPPDPPPHQGRRSEASAPSYNPLAIPSYSQPLCVTGFGTSAMCPACPPGRRPPRAPATSQPRRQEQPRHAGRALRCRPPDRHRPGRLERVLAGRGCSPSSQPHSLAPCALSLSAESAHALAVPLLLRLRPTCRVPVALPWCVTVCLSLCAPGHVTPRQPHRRRRSAGPRQCRPMSVHMRVCITLRFVKDRMRHRALASYHPEDSRALGRLQLFYMSPTAPPPQVGPRAEHLVLASVPRAALVSQA